MKLVIIYGPPAAGKLTVANALAERTGYKVFHNHLSIDCVKPVFDFGSPPFGRLVEKIRIETIAEAAREGVDLIHTFVYANISDDDYFARLIAAGEDNGAEVCLVLLRCSKDETKRRVTSESRSRIGKIATPEMLDSVHEKHDLYSPFPGRATLVMDNTELLPIDAAERVIDYYAIRRTSAA